jgi:hypothetical protein
MAAMSLRGGNAVLDYWMEIFMKMANTVIF